MADNLDPRITSYHVILVREIQKDPKKVEDVKQFIEGLIDPDYHKYIEELGDGYGNVMGWAALVVDDAGKELISQHESIVGIAKDYPMEKSWVPQKHADSALVADCQYP